MQTARMYATEVCVHTCVQTCNLEGLGLKGLGLEGFGLFFWLVLLVALSVCLSFFPIHFLKVTETSREAFCPGRVHLALLRQAGLQITATCLVAGTHQEAMCSSWLWLLPR